WHRPKWAHQSMSREEYERLPEKVLVRMVKVRVQIPGFRVQEYEVLTTLIDPQEYPKESFGELYFLRWRAEVYLDDIKTTLGMDMLSCKSPEMIARELIVGFLAHNTVRIQMAQAAECLEVPLEQISFSTTVRVLRTYDQCRLDPDSIAVKLATIVHRRVGNRPGRSEPRAVKRKGKTYPSLKTPRRTLANCKT
ncbi:MAG TPA: IS4/IS5 family transposase, partial [Bacteroidetes bacterium]|nr:IS4/IS5 family transposase [Bacteroidota bacterium]